MLELQKKLGYEFNDPLLLVQALTHRSYSAAHNERLEFLGDSVLGAAVASRLFHMLPDAPEGDLSRIRAHLVREATLHPLALTLGLNHVLRLGEGEMRSGGAERASILADALEAVIGAMYLDGGFTAVQDFVERIFQPEFEGQKVGAVNWGKDAKTTLQEWLQARHLPLPVYTVSATHGALHEQIFEVQCAVLPLNMTALGSGTSKRNAEQDAAQHMLHLLTQQPLVPQSGQKNAMNKRRPQIKLRSTKGHGT